MIFMDKDPNFKSTTAFSGNCEIPRRFVDNSTVKLQRGVKVGTPVVRRLRSCSRVVWRLNAAIWSLDWTWELLFSIQERGEKLVAGGLQTLQIHYGFWIEWVIVVSYGPRLSAGLCCNITTGTKHEYGKPYFLVYRHFDVCLPLDDVFEILIMSIDEWFLRVKSPI